MADLAKDKFHLPARLGFPKGISGVKDDLSLATVCGLVLLGFDLEGGEKSFTSGRGLGSRIKKAFKIFIP